MKQETLPGITPVETAPTPVPKLVSADHVFQIEPEVAICPYCGGALVVQAIEWEIDEDDYGTAGAIDMDCLEDTRFDHPAIGPNPIDHTRDPYVHWFPAEDKVLAWLRERYRFDMDDYGLVH